MQASLCVGAVSRRVVEVAATLGVRQVVASRRQVDTTRSYTGLTQPELVRLVGELSEGRTAVVRDHGGPNQGWDEDDGVASLDADVAAGFDGLHLDVSKLPYGDRHEALAQLVKRYRTAPGLEIGGEHDRWLHNLYLLELARELEARPAFVVAEAGTFVWAERQRPVPPPTLSIEHQRVWAHNLGAGLKAHNADFMTRAKLREWVDAYNLAPELATVEIDALIAVLPESAGVHLLDVGYAIGDWHRWFNDGEGTEFERARCGARYVLERPEVREVVALDDAQERFVRRRIQDAIEHG